MESINIGRLIAGDKAAFNLFYERYSEQVYHLAYRFLKNTEQSEEILQEVFLKLWVNRESLDEKGIVWNYLYVLTKRQSLNQLREIRRSADLFQRLVADIRAAHNTAEDRLLETDIERRVNEALLQLPPRQLTIFTLSRKEGLSHQEIAQKLQISPNTVKNHLVQALKTLKVQLLGLLHLLIILLAAHFK